MARKRLIIGNWKMNGSTELVDAFSRSFASHEDISLNHTQIAVCPPFVYLSQMAKSLSGGAFALGAQDVSAFEKGAYTGQISAGMLKEQGCQVVIVGHCERRQFCGETNEMVANKFFAAKAAGLTPVLCVGESNEQRQANQTQSVVLSQILPLLDRDKNAFSQAVLAYEPIWAIGTGLVATPDEAQSVHRLLRETIAEYDAPIAADLPILYGGSVKATNASELFAMEDIDGALVGGASLSVDEFIAICKAEA